MKKIREEERRHPNQMDYTRINLLELDLRSLRRNFYARFLWCSSFAQCFCFYPAEETEMKWRKKNTALDWSRTTHIYLYFFRSALLLLLLVSMLLVLFDGFCCCCCFAFVCSYRNGISSTTTFKWDSSQTSVTVFAHRRRCRAEHTLSSVNESRGWNAFGCNCLRDCGSFEFFEMEIEQENTYIYFCDDIHENHWDNRPFARASATSRFFFSQSRN